MTGSEETDSEETGQVSYHGNSGSVGGGDMVTNQTAQIPVTTEPPVPVTEQPRPEPAPEPEPEPAPPFEPPPEAPPAPPLDLPEGNFTPPVEMMRAAQADAEATQPPPFDDSPLVVPTSPADGAGFTWPDVPDDEPST